MHPRRSICLLALVTLGCAEEPLDMSGTTWHARFLEADYGNADLQGVISIVLSQEILIGVHSMDESSIELRLAMSIPDTEPPEQDNCGIVQELPTAQRDGLSFALGPEDYDFKAYNNAYPMQDLEIRGSLAEDGSSLSLESLAMEVDLRTSAESLGYESADSLCSLTATLSMPCTPCEDGSETCLVSLVQDIPTTLLEGTLVEVSEAWTHADCVPPED
jgi:hypothetical protein